MSLGTNHALVYVKSPDSMKETETFFAKLIKPFNIQIAKEK